MALRLTRTLRPFCKAPAAPGRVTLSPLWTLIEIIAKMNETSSRNITSISGTISMRARRSSYPVLTCIFVSPPAGDFELGGDLFEVPAGAEPVAA